MYLKVARDFGGRLEVTIKGRENIYFMPVNERKSHQLKGLQGTLDLMVKRTGRENIENIGFINDDKP